MAEKKEKQYLSDNAQLMAEWNWEKNSDINPELITLGSEKRAWWKCIKGHEWEAKIYNRNKGNSCPYCSGKYAIKGENDLQTINPILAAEWNHDKNNHLTPADVTPNSGKKVWWKCSAGHEWQAKIQNRTNGNGCPYCSGRYAIIGKNDLQSMNPSLAKEWNHEKNGNLKPEDFTQSSSKKVWWICSKWHEWQAPISNRSKGVGCPICKSERHTSFPEYALLYYLKKHDLEAIHLFKEKGYELDIYIPSKKVAIEYDGYLWHKGKEKKDLAKNQKCKEDKIQLYRMREGLPSLNDSSIDYLVQKEQKDLSEVLREVLSVIVGTNVDVDIERDTIAIENLREYTEKENSLLFVNPKVAKEWNHKRNGNLKPEYCAANADKRVWWICSEKHEWQAMIYERNHGTGCPYCSNRKILPGYNDLQTINPILAKEWNYAKNNNLKPENFTANSNKKVWWTCSKGHEWYARIAHRNKGSGCPYCAGQKVIKGETDLQTVNSALANEWNYEKNNKLTPIDVASCSGKKIWWKCSKGHEWQARIVDRCAGNGCPFCSGRYLLKGENDLQTVNPVLATEWNYKKNNELTPLDVKFNSNKKVWWKCINGHEWQATVKNRSNKSGCPYCANQKVLKGYNDLQTTNPTLAAEWNFARNGDLKPEHFTANSGKKAWWKCSYGHEWQAVIGSRNKGHGCPECAKNRKK
ncbi:MAG: hypothetical protein E7659_04280 [Ruminococcaceae bacterium]|nr:hypothetical protein [Oscillospiraceae bacterium]